MLTFTALFHNHYTHNTHDDTHAHYKHTGWHTYIPTDKLTATEFFMSATELANSLK